MIIEKLTDFLKLNIPSEFGTDDEDYEDEFTGSLNEVVDQLKDNVDFSYFYGASQFAIVPKNSDVVIKIPMNGYFCYNKDTDDSYFDPYQTDHCALTIIVYDKIYEYDPEVAKLFVPVECIGSSINDVPIYTQPKVADIAEDVICFNTGSKDKHEYYSEKSYKMVVNSREEKQWYYLDSEWIATVVDMYGEDLVNRLMEMLDTTDFVEDLHSRNYGWDAEGRPVIFDYAGFQW